MARPAVSLGVGVALLAAGASLLAMPAASVAQDATPVKVLHIVLDSLHPSQVGPDTPNLQMLKDQGVWYEQHRAVMSSETLPNHVAMSTGTYPATNNIPGNDGRDQPGDTEAGDLGVQAYRTADSFTVALERVCPELSTVTAFAKPYVYLTFEGEADADYPQPTFHVPGIDTAPDASIMTFLGQQIGQNGLADYTFVNFGDIDRAGHGDAAAFTGQTTLQRAFLQEADTNVGLLVAGLQASGDWDNTVLIINSDHSMDWTPALTGNVDVMAALEANPATAGAFFAASNGGAMFVYLLDPARPDAEAMLLAARTTIVGITGVDLALYREPNSLDPGNDLRAVHPSWRNWTHRAGEIFVAVESGFKAGSVSSNPLPGNHGMVATRHATMLVTGGWSGVNAGTVIAADPALVDPYDDTEALPGQSEQVDVAPTVGWLLGIPDPGISRGDGAQWEGRVLAEAFASQPAPACQAAVEPAVEESPEPTAAPTPEAAEESEPALPATGGGLAAMALGLALLTGGGYRPRHATPR